MIHTNTKKQASAAASPMLIPLPAHRRASLDLSPENPVTLVLALSLFITLNSQFRSNAKADLRFPFPWVRLRKSRFPVQLEASGRNDRAQ